MQQPSQPRTDGIFGTLYGEHRDVRAVVAAYRELFECGYRQAWAAWFEWAFGLPTKAELRRMVERLEIG